MKNETITARIPIELNGALKAYAEKHFGGDKSDAIRFILNYFFNEGNEEKIAAMYTIYANVAPKIVARIAQVAHDSEKIFKAEIIKILQKVS